MSKTKREWGKSMSAKATFWAWEQKLKSSQKLVLLCLADCHNNDTNRCDPSIIYIASQTGLDKKTVGNALKYLENSTMICGKKEKGKSTKYTLNLSQNWVYPKTGVPQKRVNPNMDLTPPKNGSTPPPKTGHEPTKNLKRNYKGINLQNLPKGITEEDARNYIDHREAKKSKLIQSSFDLIMKKAIKPNSVGLTPSEVLAECAARGWTGLEVKWLTPKEQQPFASGSKNYCDRYEGEVIL